MEGVRTYILVTCFILQGAINLLIYGFPAIMFSALIPDRLYPKIAWILPFLVLTYFSLGIASLHYLSSSHNFSRGRFLGASYFAIGAFGSLRVIADSWQGHETPMLIAVFFTWLAISLLGILLLGRLREFEIPQTLSLLVMILLTISAMVSAINAQWVFSDYYINYMKGNIPNSATVFVGYPNNASPPNVTG